MSNGVNSGVGQAAWLRFNARGLPVSVRPEAAPEAAQMNPPGRRNGQKDRKAKQSGSSNDHLGGAVPPRQMALAYESAKAAALLALSSQEGHGQPGGLGTADQSGNALAVGAASLALRALRETLGASQHPNEGSQYSSAAAALAAPAPGIFRPLSPSEQSNINEGLIRPGTGIEESVGEAAANEPLGTENTDENEGNEAKERSLSPLLRVSNEDDVEPQSENVDDGDSPSSERGDGSAMVGRAVQKEFGEDGWFAGSVVAAKWLEGAGAWQYEVLFEDGDVELLDVGELNAIIDPAEIAARPNEEAAAPGNETNVRAGLTAAIANDGGNGTAEGENSGMASEEGKVQGGQGGVDGQHAATPPLSAFHSFPTPDLKPSQEGAAATANVAAAAVPVADMSVEQMMVRSPIPVASFEGLFLCYVHAFIHDISVTIINTFSRAFTLVFRNHY